MTAAPDLAAAPLVPVLHRVVGRRRETADTVTLRLAPLAAAGAGYRPGQFHMLTAYGVGEIAISISGGPTDGSGPVHHTVRSVGAVSEALCRSRRGDVVGVRGPYGQGWEVDGAAGDLVVVGGGLGLAPLRPSILEAVAGAGREGRRVFVLAGARAPELLLYPDELQRWAQHAGVVVDTIVDHARPGWRGQVGLITRLVETAKFEPAQTTALVCGPEVMMRFVISALLTRGVRAERVRVSLERNMKCGVGWCGHCQLGPVLVCRDGPVLTADRAAPLLAVPEL